MDDKEADGRETAAYRAACDVFAAKLVEKLAPDTTTRDAALQNLAGTSHVHQTVVVLASSLAVLAQGGDPRAMMMQVLVKFGPVETVKAITERYAASAPVGGT